MQGSSKGTHLLRDHNRCKYIGIFEYINACIWYIWVHLRDFRSSALFELVIQWPFNDEPWWFPKLLPRGLELVFNLWLFIARIAWGYLQWNAAPRLIPVKHGASCWRPFRNHLFCGSRMNAGGNHPFLFFGASWTGICIYFQSIPVDNGPLKQSNTKESGPPF